MALSAIDTSCVRYSTCVAWIERTYNNHVIGSLASPTGNNNDDYYIKHRDLPISG